jgi:N,N-dimethylformamidase
MKRNVDHKAMNVAGYSVPWSAPAGATFDLHLSVAVPITSITVCRLDGIEYEDAGWDVCSVGGPPSVQAFDQGSYVSIDPAAIENFDCVNAISFELLLTRNPGHRTVLDAGDLHAGLDDGDLTLVWRGNTLLAKEPLPSQTWLTVRLAKSDAGLTLDVIGGDTLAPCRLDRSFAVDGVWNVASGRQICFGWREASGEQTLNARFADIRLIAPRGVFAWTFPTMLPQSAVLSSGGDQPVALTVHNLPTFCVSSLRWDGSRLDPKFAPSHFDAIHCHDDDMGPLDWPSAFQVSVPEDARPGVYAFDIAYDGGTEKIVFFVTALKPAADLVFLVPTATYLAYADEALPERHFPWQCEDRGHRFAADNNLRSLYDYHTDLSGVSICSYKKPKSTLRDDYMYPLCGCPHNLPVDLHFLKFCRANAIPLDIVTDHDLHTHGIACLDGYQAVITGSHPEYMSCDMEGALRHYAGNGGSIAYLGGNGLSATVAFRDDLMELRRSPLEAGRTWDGPVHEQVLALNNEPGGLLRNRGRGEFSLVGVGISLMGFEKGQPYTRTEASRRDDCAWLFEGVNTETFGDYGLVLGGAAGYEVDATDHHLGTSSDTIVVARATGFGAHFMQDATRWHEGGLAELTGKRCAEMTLRHLPAGGLIFTASSVAWMGALPTAGSSMNDVGLITLNLLKRVSGRGNKNDGKST